MLVYILQMITGYMKKPVAFHTFEMKMGTAVACLIDILIAGTSFSVDRISPYKTFFHKLIKLSVDSRNTYRCPLRGEEGTYLLHTCMLILI